MRTTVEITDEQRGRLLKLAAERGEKGFPRLVQEALDRFLEEEARQKHERNIRRALSALGSLDERTAEEMRESVRRIRRSTSSVCRG
jgi:hypothetical protein